MIDSHVERFFTILADLNIREGEPLVSINTLAHEANCPPSVIRGYLKDIQDYAADEGYLLFTRFTNNGEGEYFRLIRIEEPEESTDSYNAHYQGDVEPIDLMAAQMTPEAFKGFLRGNIIKYASRFGKKDAEEKEATKILWYATALYHAVVNNREETK